MEPEEFTKDLHPAALMLPWYVAGTLTDIECQEVEAHLAQCPSCQQELEDVRQLKGALQSHQSDLPGPSPQVFENVMARIKAETKAQTQESRRNESESMASKVESFLRGLFIPQWAPALAVALIVGQASFIIFMSQTKSVEQAGRPGFPPGPVIERSVPRATVSNLTVNIRLAFKEGTSESELRAIIQNLKGRIIDGPTKDGDYTIAVPKGDPNLIDHKLQSLLTGSSAVRVAERVTP